MALRGRRHSAEHRQSARIDAQGQRLNAVVRRARGGLVKHPAQVLLDVRVERLARPLLVPLDQVRVLYAVRGRPACARADC